MNVLFVSPYPPSGIRRRPYEFIRGLRRGGHNVTVAAVVGDDARREDAQDHEVLLGGMIELPIGRTRRSRSVIRAVLAGEPMQAGFDWSPQNATRLSEIVDSGQFDVLHVEHLRGASYGLPLCDRLPVVWDAVDSIRRLFEQAARLAPTAGARWAARLELGPTSRYEAKLTKRFHATVITSSADAEALADGSSDAHSRIQVVPNGVDLDAFRPTELPARRETVVMTGKLSYHANVAAACWLLDQVMPIVWASRPSLKLIFAGARPSPLIKRAAQRHPNRIEITGAVESLRPMLQEAGVVVAPLVYCVGIQNKVLEAMACGAPIVATPPAVEALSVTSGTECLVAEDPSGFAQAILSILANPESANTMGQNARAYVDRFHRWDSSISGLERAYQQAIERYGVERLNPVDGRF